MNRANRAILMLRRLKSSRVWVAKSTGNPCDVLQIQTLDTDSGSKCPLTEVFKFIYNKFIKLKFQTFR